MIQKNMIFFVIALLVLPFIQAQVTHKSQAIKQIVSTAKFWRSVQEQIKDTVVQVFSCVGRVDLSQPHRSPDGMTISGTGFFINKEGYFITCEHVVNQGIAIGIQIPSFGKWIFDVEVVGVSPDRDLALCRVSKEGVELIKKELGSIPYLTLGNSDAVCRSDEVMALGYPLGKQALKSTKGVVSSCCCDESGYIETTAPINPGSSGGALLNDKGEVIGINSSGIQAAQNVGYAIPVNYLTIILENLYKTKFLREPFLGVMFNNATESLTEYFNNPLPGGAYVVGVLEGSVFGKAGIQCGDMIYEIHGNDDKPHILDIYGEMNTSWLKDGGKTSIFNYIRRLSPGQDINLVVYRFGERKNITIKFSDTQLPGVHEVYPGDEPIDYEVLCGMIVQPLTLNHLQLLGGYAPGLVKYIETQHRIKPVLVITHIFPSSHLHRSRTINIGSIIHEINGIKVSTLDEYRQAIKKSAQEKFLIISFSDNVARRSDNVLVALPWDKLIKQEPELSQTYKYPLSEVWKTIIQSAA